MIRKIYHVSVDIPPEIWERFGNSSEYERLSIDATAGNIEAGTDYYSDPFEWAEFHTLEEAKQCERKLQLMIGYFQKKLEQ